MDCVDADGRAPAAVGPWTGGRSRYPWGAYASATGINSRGQVVGWSDVPTASGAPHPFLWENGVMRDLGTFGGVFAVAAGINDRGQVTGSSTDANVNSHAFLWDGEMVALGTLGADRVSTGQLINERGEVAGLKIGRAHV